MSHRTREEAGVTVVELDGEVDVTAAPDVRDLLASLLDRSGARVLLDLSAVSFIDSSGVGILVTAHRKADEAGASFGLAAPSATVSRVFELTRTNRLLEIFPTVEQGIAGLRG